MECGYCKKIFSNNSSLKVHQTTAKYCIKIQNNPIEKEYFECEFCSKNFSTKTNLKTHEKNCWIY